MELFVIVLLVLVFMGTLDLDSLFARVKEERSPELNQGNNQLYQ